ncbi:MAG: hypothetical protein AAF754_08705 [Pseudomonadota bacterium]
MKQLQTEISNVIYNAAEQAFEARVSVHDSVNSVSYACSIKAPINMSFERAAKGLTQQALRRHGAPKGVFSKIAPTQTGIVHRLVPLRRGLPLGQYGFFRGRAA